MQSDLDNLVLETIAFDQVFLPTENRYYDPTMRFIKAAGRASSALTFDIDKIMTQYVTDRTDVLRITLPATVYIRRRGPKPQVPSLWEMGGLSRDGYIGRPSWCTIIGSITGERVSRQDVCQVRYQTPDHHSSYPSGRHALCAVEPNTMFIIAQRSTTGTFGLIYRIDDVLDWPTQSEIVIPPERTYVALNCSLIGIRQIQGEKVIGWTDNKRLTTDEQGGVARLFRLSQVKLATPAQSPCNIELFWHAATNSSERNCHVLPDDCDVTTHEVSDPIDFVAEVIARVGDYRKILAASDLPIRNHPIPGSVHYGRNTDDTVDIVVEIPSVLDNFQHFAISTKITGDIPLSLLLEPTLCANALSADELIGSLTIDEPIMHNIFTYC